MSALDELRKKQERTHLEQLCIASGYMVVSDAKREIAAEELAILQDELKFFRTQFPTAAKNYRNAMQKMKEIENG